MSSLSSAHTCTSVLKTQCPLKAYKVGNQLPSTLSVWTCLWCYSSPMESSLRLGSAQYRQEGVCLIPAVLESPHLHLLLWVK